MLDLLEVVRLARPVIDTGTESKGTASDAVLAVLRPGLVGLGYEVEASKAKAQRVRRPVLFGPQGAERVAYESMASTMTSGSPWRSRQARGAQSSAVYRDLVRASLIVEARFFALGVMNRYRFRSGTAAAEARSYEAARNQLDAIYAIGRLRLPFDGVLLFGY